MDLADVHRAAVGTGVATWPRAACRCATSTRSGSTAPFLQAVADAAPQADVVLVHASASELCRLFARGTDCRARGDDRCGPLLLADDRPASVTHAYAAMKLLTQRAGLVVHDLLLGAAPHSPRAERIAMQLATCADDFLGRRAARLGAARPGGAAPTEAPTPATAPPGARDAAPGSAARTTADCSDRRRSVRPDRHRARQRRLGLGA